MPNKLDKSEIVRKYILIINRREFHRTDSEQLVCVPNDADYIGYSDSKEHLMNQGNLPCRFCLSDISMDEINSARDTTPNHTTFKVG